METLKHNRTEPVRRHAYMNNYVGATDICKYRVFRQSFPSCVVLITPIIKPSIFSSIYSTLKRTILSYRAVDDKLRLEAEELS